VCNGESQFVQNGEVLQRLLRVVEASIYYTDKSGDTYRLAEEKQVMRSGVKRVRTELASVSMAEKMKVNEYALQALWRGIKEELGIGKEDYRVISGPQIYYKERTSNSYPGLRTRYEIARYVIELAPQAYIADGYIEEQLDKSVHFSWSRDI